MKIKVIFSVGCFLLLLLFAVSKPVAAQTITGIISGTVTDPSGALIPGAKITVTNEQTNESVKAESSASGAYEVPYLNPGAYQIEAAQAGFETMLQRHINLHAQSRIVVNFTLPVGSTATKVDVVGRPPLLDSTTSSLGQIVSSTTAANLPILGRNIFDLVGVSAGVHVNPTVLGGVAAEGTNSSPEWTQADISINGGAFRTNEFLFDGVSITVPNRWEFAFSPTPDDVQEFKVISNSVGPQFGRTEGGTVSIVSKSGTNNWHGSIYDFERNQRFFANQYFANATGTKLAPLNFELWGASIGGPLIKNKTFIFATYEGSRNHGSTPGQLLTIPNAAEHQGNFSQRLASNGQAVTIYNPFTTTLNGSAYTRTAFPGNIIPTQDMDPVAVNMLKLIPLPNLTGTGPAQANNFVWALNAFTNSDQWSTQINHRFSDRNSMFGIVTRNDGKIGNNGPFNDPADLAFGPAGDHTLNIVLNDTITISPTSFLNLRAGATRRFEYRTREFSVSATTLGFPSAIAAAEQYPDFPNITFSNYSSWGEAGTEIWKGDGVYTAVAEMTKIHGRHTLIYGGDVRLYDLDSVQAGNPGGAYSFSSSFTQGPNPQVASLTAGDSLASFLTGYGSGSINIAPAVAVDSWYLAPYITDAIRLGRLTVNVGTRWDYALPLRERFNRLADFNPTEPFPITVAGLPNLVGVLTHPGQGGQARTQTNSYFKAFGPRVGLAYQLNSQLVARAAYGIFYAPPIGYANGGEVSDAGYAPTTTWVASVDGVTPLNPISNPYPNGLLQPASAGGEAGLLQLGQSIGVDERTNVQNTNVQQWNFNLQYQPAGSWLLQAAFAGNKGTHLPVYLNFINQLNPVYQSLGAAALAKQVTNPFYGLVTTGTLSTPTIAESQLLEPYPQYTGGGMNAGEYTSNQGESNYNALELSAEHHFSHGVSMSLSWTSSKQISDVSGRVFTYTSGSPPTMNVYNIRQDRSLDEADVSRRLAIGHVLELPVGRGKRYLGGASGALNEIVGGWSADGLFTYNTGFPLPLTSSGSTCVGGSGLQRPNAVAGVSPNLSGRLESRLGEYFNTAAYAIPATCTFGDASRTTPTVRGPSLWNDNLAVAKMFPVKESVSIMFRAEAFNFLNTPYFGLPGLALGSSTFGVISGASNARQVQFALKILF